VGVATQKAHWRLPACRASSNPHGIHRVDDINESSPPLSARDGKKTEEKKSKVLQIFDGHFRTRLVLQVKRALVRPDRSESGWSRGSVSRGRRRDFVFLKGAGYDEQALALGLANGRIVGVVFGG
jgi:hypothetical protein